MSRHWTRSRTLAVVAAVVVLAVLGAAIARPWDAASRDEAWARIQRDGVLRVGMEASFPPFEYLDEQGAFQGLDVDLARALGERWGVEVEFVNVHLDGLYDALAVGKFDLIISALPYDRTLTRDVGYSHSYVNAGQVLVARTPSGGGPAAGFSGLDGLAGRAVGVELGTEGHQLLRRLVREGAAQVEVLPVRESADLAAALAQGAVDAVVCDRVQALALQSGDADLRIVGEPLTHEPYVIAVDAEASELLRQVNAALTAWRADGTLDALEARWFATTAR